jgi:hypothetical protein
VRNLHASSAEPAHFSHCTRTGLVKVMTIYVYIFIHSDAQSLSRNVAGLKRPYTMHTNNAHKTMHKRFCQPVCTNGRTNSAQNDAHMMHTNDAHKQLWLTLQLRPTLTSTTFTQQHGSLHVPSCPLLVTVNQSSVAASCWLASAGESPVESSYPAGFPYRVLTLVHAQTFHFMTKILSACKTEVNGTIICTVPLRIHPGA